MRAELLLGVSVAVNTAIAVAIAAVLCSWPLKYPLNPAQTTAAIAYVVAILTWIQAEVVFPNLPAAVIIAFLGSKDDSRELEEAQELNADDPGRPPKLLFEAPAGVLKALRASAELSAIMMWMYVCDRTDMVGIGAKHQNKIEFWAVFLTLVVLSLLGLRRTKDAGAVDADTVKPLQREQTEEWKGWMQVMFLLYHYWMASEMYNAIRIYIAAYIWMTGFGNFSYYYIRRDFGLPRFVQMMWRLNFLVIFVCVTLNNEYMLYYICPLHTLFTIAVYGTLYVQSDHNQARPALLLGKIAAVTMLCLLIWDVPGVFDVVWKPLQPLLGYKGDLFQMKMPIMHEWHFRSHLDHLVWIFGMLIAYNFPTFDVWINSLDGGRNAPPQHAKRCACRSMPVVAAMADNTRPLGLPAPLNATLAMWPMPSLSVGLFQFSWQVQPSPRGLPSSSPSPSSTTTPSIRTHPSFP